MDILVLIKNKNQLLFKITDHKISQFFSLL